jgi:hypothetical protein
MGKGKGSGSDSASDHVSRPLSTLKDPALFGPPPKNVNYHGGVALPNEITPHRGGLGAPLSEGELNAAEQKARATPPHEEEEEEIKPAAPPLPYRADRTGLKTNHLPPPPVHRAIAEQLTSQTAAAAQAPPKVKPSVPPRLPARRDQPEVASSVSSVQPPPTYDAAVQQTPVAEGGLNQNAVSRLAKAGISVPGFGIGKSNPWKAEQSSSNTSASTTTSAPQLNELQSRFAQMNSGSPKPESVPAEGTTLAQKQAAFKTAQDFHKDPSSVTFADAKGAASTANNFRQRHQEQISAGAQKVNTWNKKFNVTGRVNDFLEKQASPATEQPPVVPAVSPPPPDAAALSNRKPPPPPPPKKPAGFNAPPPVPLGTKPSFG